MKKLIPIIFVLLALSCAKTTHEKLKSVDLGYLDTKAQDLNFKIDLERLDTIYFVKKGDIERYLHFRQLLDSTSKKVETITSFDIQGATLFYILNYEEGWELLSADKRTQPVLGRSQTGSFSMKEYEKTPWGTWSYTLGLDVLNERLYGVETTVEENENLAFWGSLEGPVHVSSVNRPIIIEPGPGTGYYVLSSVRALDVYDTINVPHLTTTLWKQNGYSYEGNHGNPFVPFKSDGSGYRAPSGCVAVAGAQQAYYMHQTFGKPVTAPSEGSCNDVVREPYDSSNPYLQNFSDFNTQIWDDMGAFNNKASDLLIGYIGKVVGMKYGNSGSGTGSQTLRSYFSENGITCDHNYYEENNNYLTAIYRDLYSRNIPIILFATNDYGGGHSFLIDSYKYQRRKYEYTYEWQWLPGILGNGNLIPIVFDEIVYTYEYYTTQLIRMNWGWGLNYNNMEFTPIGSWTVTPSEDYHNGRIMLHNFQF